jgi:hypothetical protein
MRLSEMSVVQLGEHMSSSTPHNESMTKIGEKDGIPQFQIKQLHSAILHAMPRADLYVLRINSLLDPRSQMIHTTVTC